MTIERAMGIGGDDAFHNPTHVIQAPSLSDGMPGADVFEFWHQFNQLHLEILYQAFHGWRRRDFHHGLYRLHDADHPSSFQDGT